MTKDELIKYEEYQDIIDSNINKMGKRSFKQIMEEPLYVTDGISTHTITYYTLLKNEKERFEKTEETVRKIESYLNQIIMGYDQKDIEFEEINLIPQLKVIVEENDIEPKVKYNPEDMDINDNYNMKRIKPDAKPYPVVEFSIIDYFCRNEEDIFGYNPEIFSSKYKEKEYIDFDVFVKLLEEKGLKLDNGNSVEDLRDSIINGEPVKITISFKKEKEELKEYNRILDTMLYIDNGQDFRYPLFPCDLDNIRINLKTKDTSENIELLFEDILEYYSKHNITIDKISITPIFGIILKADDIDKNKKIKPNAIPSNIVQVKINHFSCISGEEEITMNPYERDTYFERALTTKKDYVDFNNFLVELQSRGLKLDGITSIEDIKNKIINGEPAYGEITKTLNKTKEKSKPKIKSIKAIKINNN